MCLINIFYFYIINMKIVIFYFEIYHYMYRLFQFYMYESFHVDPRGASLDTGQTIFSFWLVVSPTTHDCLQFQIITHQPPAGSISN